MDKKIIFIAIRELNKKKFKFQQLKSKLPQLREVLRTVFSAHVTLLH